MEGCSYWDRTGEAELLPGSGPSWAAARSRMQLWVPLSEEGALEIQGR